MLSQILLASVLVVLGQLDVAVVQAWTSSTTTTTTTTTSCITNYQRTTTATRVTPMTQLNAASSSSSSSTEVSRRDLFRSTTTAAAAAATSLALASFASSAFPSLTAAALAADDDEAQQQQQKKTLPNGVTYVVNQVGNGPVPERGELVAIRFRAFAGANKIDDIFDTPEPYYTRIGSGGLIKGVEDALPYMRVGDRWTLTIPGSLAFGSKGRPSSAGKPRIPSDATIIFEVSMEGLPGKEPELIELIGDV